MLLSLRRREERGLELELTGAWLEAEHSSDNTVEVGLVQAPSEDRLIVYSLVSCSAPQCILSFLSSAVFSTFMKKWET